MRVAAGIALGAWCRDCGGGRCRDDKGEKLIECVVCLGKGCDACQHGRVALTGCPQRHAAGIGSTIALIDMAERGHLPVGGGVLDQAAWFIEAHRFYSADIEQGKAEARK